jgi:1,4-alpha-glucan branching enzyme
VPQEIDANDPTGWFSQKRSTLAAALVFTAPGIPMLFQGQEFLEGGWFRDTVPVDWDKREEFRGIIRLYRDLIRLRLNSDGQTRGLIGQNVQLIRVDDANKVIAFRRWMDGGPGDDVIVMANFDVNPRNNFEFGFPAAGAWKLHLNSDWTGYSSIFKGYPSGDVTAVPGDYDGLPAHAPVNIGPYTVLVFSQSQ